MQDDINTVVVPAYEEQVQKIFLEKDCWYGIAMAPDKRSRIRYIAIYQTYPQSAITYVAKVRSIEDWSDDPKKCVLNLAEKPRKIGPIRLVKKSKGQLRRSRYTNYERLVHAQSLNDVF